MEKVELDYYDEVRETKRYKNGGGLYLSSEIKLIRTEIIEAENEIKIFEKFYEKNNRKRYCYGAKYKFKSPIWQNKYDNWLKSDDYKQKSFKLYYGNGVVD